MSQRRSRNASGGIPGNEGVPRSDPAERRDRSDLVDVRAMAARTRARDSGGIPRPNPAELSGVQVHRSSVVGARLTPPSGIVASAAQLPNWLWTVLGCLSVLVVGFGVLWWIASSSSPEVAATPPAPPPARVAVTAPEPPAPSPVGAAGRNIQVQPLAVPAAVADPVLMPVHLPRGDSRRYRYRHRYAAPAAAGAAPVAAAGGTAAAKPDEAAPAGAAAPSPAAPAAVEKAAPAEAPAKDEGAGAEAEAEAPAPPPVREKRTAAEVAVLGEADDTPAKEPPPREVVEAALKALTPNVRRCFFKFQIPGKAQVKLVATPQGGEAETVSVAGEFEGTPTGECVTAAVAGAPLPAFKGAALRLSHTYVLR